MKVTGNLKKNQPENLHPACVTLPQRHKDAKFHKDKFDKYLTESFQV